MKKWTKLVWASVAALVLVASIMVFAFGKKESATPVGLTELTNVVNEIMSVGEFYRSPEPNHANSELIFMRSTEGGRGLFKADLLNHSVKELRRKSEARYLFSWSADDQYLLLKDFEYNENLRLYNTRENSFKGATKELCRGVGQAVWPNATRFVYISQKGDSAELRLVKVGEEHEVLRTFPSPGTMNYMAVLSDNEIAYLENREIWAFNLESKQARQITTNVSPQFLWLNYSKENDEFLFCSGDDSDWRHLFRLSPNREPSRKRIQLTFGPEHTYNGQWIQQGTGFAYVGSLTNHFYLAVRPAAPELKTNLFLGGHVLSYRVAAEGNKIYAAAAVGAEPPGIWEYEIAAKKLRCVVPGTNAPFAHSVVISRTEHRAKSFDGLTIPYYVLPPRAIDASRKYPVVFAVPPEDGQFMQAWEKYSQFMANIGLYHIAVNPRGSDGYGNAFKKLDDSEAWRDVLAVAEKVLKISNVDRKRAFLMTYSNGGHAVNRLVKEHPELWDGIILISCDPPKSEVLPGKMPRFFLFMGEKDLKGLVQRTQAFEQWAATNSVRVTALYGKNTFHHITSVGVDKDMGAALAEFIFDQGTSLGGSAKNQRN